MEHFEPKVKDTDTREFFPYLKVLLLMVMFEETDFIETVVQFLLFDKLLKRDKLNLLKVILCQSSFRDYHVLMWIPTLELNNLPFVRVKRACFIHVTELVRHLPVNPIT